MNNVENRLRKFAEHNAFGPAVGALLKEAADEIERLERHLRGIEVALSRDENVPGAMEIVRAAIGAQK